MNGTGDIERFVREALRLPERESFRLTPVQKGGSDRLFFRLTRDGGESFVVMWYNPERTENNYFAAISGFLAEIGIRVPRIFLSDPAGHYILMEDLGETDLWSLREASWDFRRELYRASLDEIGKLHAFDLERFRGKGVPVMPGFDAALFRWERDYFRENFVKGICGIDPGKSGGDRLEMELSSLAERFLTEGNSLIHRDFQSQNILVREGRPAFIDYQGMRQGSPFYDLASLLYDPYVSFREDERIDLLGYYHRESSSKMPFESFVQRFREAACQRLMQALGAYGFLGRIKGKPDFLKHIPAGLANLLDASERAGNLPVLHRLVSTCRDLLRKRPAN